MNKAIFVVNGLGLGNSTRCHAIIQYLYDNGVDVEVITSGNGIWYFENIKEVKAVHAINSLYYGSKNGKISVLSTLGSLKDFKKISKENNKIISNVLDNSDVKVVVSDSNYNFRPVKSRKIPLVSLNNADVVYHSYYTFSDIPKEIKMQFHCIEKMDYLYHKFIPDLVISPTFDADLPASGGRIKRIGPIVRKEYFSKRHNNDVKRAVIMLSGSVFGSPVKITHEIENVKIDVIGRPKPEELNESDNIYYHGKIKNTVEYLRQADIVVVNGGFSAVSEAFYMRKPVVVIPVPNHAEQWVNAKTMKELGVGEIATEDNFFNVMMKMLDNIELYKNNYDKITYIPNGAEQSAKMIMDFM